MMGVIFAIMAAIFPGPWLKETLYKEWQQWVKMDEKIHDEKTEHQRLMIFKNNRFGKVLALNGVIQTTEADEFIYHEMLTHVPLMAHPRPRSVLIVGGGDGGILREVLRHPSIEKVTLVEIDGAVVEQSKIHLPTLSAGAFNDPRLELLIEDGINYVRTTDQTFDVVIADPMGSARAFFTEEFYGGCKRVLKEGGILVNQNGVPFVQPEEFVATLKNRSPHFKHVTFYSAPVPTYMGGFMAFGWATNCDDYDQTPRQENLDKVQGKMRYYTAAIHTASFQLPQFMLDMMHE